MGYLNQFVPYIQRSESLLSQLFHNGNKETNKEQVLAALDGEPGRELRRLVNLDIQKSSGIFFTGKKIAERICKFPFHDYPNNLIILDPTCGAGNLLVAYAAKLPLAHNLKTTLINWGKQIRGYDIYPELVHLTKIRLVLLAILRGVFVDEKDSCLLSDTFPFIQTRNFLSTPNESREKKHILINPPFTMMKTLDGCTWANGGVSTAAVFIEKCISSAHSKTHISAILPDVLRTGTRYQKWRELIASRTKIDRIEVVGQFDKWTDIDVFIIHLTVKGKDKIKRKCTWAFPGIKTKKCIKDLFNVHVGSVVPHRHPKKGPRCKYIFARALPKNGVVKRLTTYRRFLGTLFNPPFVVVRRTSRPDDKNRIVSTIISGKKQVAVENHLMIITPHSGLLTDCKKLLANLNITKTTRWLNKRIRCRHLTVSAVRELPIWEDSYRS